VIIEFVKRFNEKEADLRAKLSGAHVKNYGALVKIVIEAITSESDYGDFSPDPERITEIDHGDYQGTLLFVVADKGYQPSKYWFVKVGYGSCSGCDTLQGICNYEADKPTASQVNDYYTLALHIVQGLKSMQDSE
jgi:hypothetical protein